MNLNKFNGKKYPTFAWIAGGLATLLLAFGMFMIADINARINKIEFEHRGGFERIATLEAQNPDITRRLRDIEEKLDKLLAKFQVF